MKYKIASFFSIFFIGLAAAVQAQYGNGPEFYGGRITPEYVRDTMLPRVVKEIIYQPVDTFIRDTLSQIVHREALRFKQALHPVFQHRDTLARLDSLYPGWAERNALCALSSHLCGYTYQPEYKVAPLKCVSTPCVVEFKIDNEPEKYYRHVYRITKKDRFIKSADTNGRADTLYEDVSHRFFTFDSLFIAYCLPQTGDYLLLSGNIFADTLPLQYLGYEPYRRYLGSRSANYERCAEIFAHLKMGILDSEEITNVSSPKVGGFDSYNGEVWYKIDCNNFHCTWDIMFARLPADRSLLQTKFKVYCYMQENRKLETLEYNSRPTNISEVMTYQKYWRIPFEQIKYLRDDLQIYDFKDWRE